MLERPNDILAVEYCKAILARAAASSPYPFAALGTTTPWTRTGKIPPPPALRRRILAGSRGWPTWRRPARPMREPGSIVCPGGAGGAGPAPDSGGGGLRSPARGLRGLAEALRSPGGRPVWRAHKAVKSKRYTRSRLNRMVLCAFLGLTAEDLAAEAPYVRFWASGTVAARLSGRCPPASPAHAGQGWKAPILPWNSGAKDCTASLARRWKPWSCGERVARRSLGGRPYVKLSPICPVDILT